METDLSGTSARPDPAAVGGVAGAGPYEPFRGLFEAAPDAMLIMDGSGIIQLVNPQAEAMFGYQREELLGRSVDILVPRRHSGRHGAHRHGYSAAGQVRPMGADLDLHGLHRDGSEFPAEISLTPLRTADGPLVWAAVRDVSERKRADEKRARLFEQQRHVALTLQRALMSQPHEIPGMRSASRYFPATAGAGVGGDWFDLIALGGGRIGVLIGDVMGRGLEAATVMGQLRSAANALARTGLPPQRLMSALDLFARDIPDQLTTCCYLVIDPGAGEVTGCSAGHLPVLLVEPDGAVRQLPVPVSAPLGVGDIPHQQASVPVAPDATLVLYTDGLVETHRCDIDERITTLADQLHAIFTAGTGLEQAADEIFAAMTAPTGEPSDDITLLLAQIPGPPLSSAAITLLAEPRSVTAGRQFTGKTLAEWGHTEHADTVCLLVSEILTNAVSHARGPIGLRVHRSATEIVTEISDDSPDLPQRRLADPDDETGRGLMLVEALATQWGTRPGPAGKTVWFTIALNRGPVTRGEAAAPWRPSSLPADPAGSSPRGLIRRRAMVETYSPGSAPGPASGWWRRAMALEESFDAGTLPGLRRAVLAEAVAAGLTEDQARDVVLAVHELAANAVRHGGGTGRLRMLATDEALHCQDSDAGPGGEDHVRAPSAVTVGPWPFQPGHGLWLVTGVADHVSIASGLVGSEVTVTFALPGAGSGQSGYVTSGSDRAGPEVTGIDSRQGARPGRAS